MLICRDILKTDKFILMSFYGLQCTFLRVTYLRKSKVMGMDRKAHAEII